MANLRNVDAGGFLDASRERVCEFVEDALKDLKNIKVNVTFYGDFELGENLEEKEFSANYEDIFRTTSLRKWFDKVRSEILTSIDDFEVQRESKQNFYRSI